jgi:hypothetical protein
MKRASPSTFAALLLIFTALAASAQMPMLKPGPEQKKLDYYVGTWTMDGDMKSGPMGPGGKFTGTDTDEWLPGGFFVQTHETFKTPMGDGTALAVIGYNSDDKVYTYHSFSSDGQTETSAGTVEGDNWTWTSDEKMGGQTMKGRYSVKVLSPTSYTFKFEMSPDGTNWSTVMEGKATKTK